MAAEESLSKASPLLEQTSNARRIDLLAASPPFIVKLEQALATVTTVDRAAVAASPGAPTRLIRRIHCRNMYVRYLICFFGRTETIRKHRGNDRLFLAQQ